MKFCITYFYDVRYFTPDMIPVSTCHSDPKWFHGDSYNKNYCFLNENNVMIGIREDSLSPSFEKLNMREEDICSKGCIHISSDTTCPFLMNYERCLDELDFEALMKEFERVSEDVRKITHYEGEPTIALLVYETESNPCSERKSLQRYFKKHGIDVPN